jgi:hypothetical protein
MHKVTPTNAQLHRGVPGVELGVFVSGRAKFELREEV